LIRIFAGVAPGIFLQGSYIKPDLIRRPALLLYTTSMNPMEKYFEELGERVLEQTMCDVCLDEFPDEELHYDPDIRSGAPVCDECYVNEKAR